MNNPGYKAFQEFFHISAKLAHELQGEDFDLEHHKIPEPLWSNTFNEAKSSDVNISTFIEHRARLAILKSAIDYKLLKESGLDQNKQWKISFSGYGSDLEFSLLDLLPKSFKSGLNAIAEQPYCHRYPVFWQWFTGVFGGFILKDYEAEEYSLLSKKTGIPENEIPNAFQSYEMLFPVKGGWFRDLSPNSNIRIMLMFPMPFRGIGANYRRIVYTNRPGPEFDGLKLTGRRTLDDLCKWNKLICKTLSNFE